VERLNGERNRPTVTLAIIGIPSAGSVVAAATGTVIRTRTNAAHGNVVALRHSGNITTRYGHLASIDRTIRPGTSVSAGQRLGVEGSTGVSTGLHLHFQVEINGKTCGPGVVHGRPRRTVERHSRPTQSEETSS
jgi:murein DD-endopeptidase MepM/ murein hydrolase activator NlpD